MHRLSWPGWKNSFNHSLPSTFSPSLARKNWNAWPCISLAHRHSRIKIGTKRLLTDTSHPLTQRINSQFLTGYRKSSLISISPWFFRRKRNTADSGYGSEQPLDRRWSQEFSQEVRITWSPDPGGDGQMACSQLALHDPNLPVDAATENAISDFLWKFFSRFDDHCPRGISQMFLFYLKLKRIKIKFKNSNHVPFGDTDRVFTRWI